MFSEGWIALMGGTAAVATTSAFVPQIMKIRQQGGRDLSYGMLWLYLVGVSLWLVYGLLIDAGAVIWANAATLILVSAALWLKYRGEMRGTTRWSRSPGERLRVAIDMDEVIADFIGKCLRALNEARGAELARRALEGRTLEEVLSPEEMIRIRELLDDPAFFRDLEVIEDSQEVVRELAEHYEVYIASAAMDVPASFAAKYAWLREHFPFIPPSHIVFCGDKSVLDVHYLIDDQPRHFERFRGTGLLFSTPHNREERRFTRVASWEEVRAHLLGPLGPLGLGSSDAPTGAS
jgi:5'(3')-deoxyribonucleotidase/uncharacterized protein with PQ loop repeat